MALINPTSVFSSIYLAPPGTTEEESASQWKSADEQASLLLDALLIGDGSKAGVMQEREGQRQLERSKVLPIEGTENNREWTALGVELGAPVEGDPLFRYVSFPAGWSICAANYDTWSNLVDDGGRVRASVVLLTDLYL